MPTKPKTWKTIADQRRKENFVGRAEQLRIFQDNFVGEPTWMVLSVTGEGGVGKSTLLKRYIQEAGRPEIDANVVLCDDRHLTSVDAMAAIAKQLASLGIESKEFNERHEKYRATLQQIESDPAAPRGMVDVVTRGLTDFAVKSLRRAPVIGVGMEYVDEKAAGDAMVELAQYTINRWGNKDEVQLVREPEKILTPLFVDLLNEAAAKKRLIIMFDVFERTATTLSSWLIALFNNSEYGGIDFRVVFIVSGRDPLEQHWTELAGLMNHVRLEPFTPEETEIYLSNQGITDKALVEQIYKDTGGLPVLVELLAATNPQPGSSLPDISQDAVERFLQWTPDENKRRIVLLAAIPRHFNLDILSTLLGDDAEKQFHWLVEQSYIRSESQRGWFYHEKVRYLILRYQKNFSPQKLTENHAYLNKCFAELQAGLQLSTRGAYRHETWRQYEAERIYHLLCSAPESHWQTVVHAFILAFHYQRYFAVRLVTLAKQAIDEMKCVELEQDVLDLEILLTSYEKGNYTQVIDQLNRLEKWVGQDQAILQTFFAQRGETYRLMGRYHDALKNFDRAIDLDEKSDSILASRGATYTQMGNYDNALQDFDRAIDLNKKNAWAIAYRGVTYRQIARYDDALKDFDRAISLDEKNPSIITNRGITYMQLGRHDDALKDFDRAVGLDDKNVGAIANRGVTYRQMERYDDALKDFDRAVNLDDKNAGAIANRGMTYYQMERYDDALKDFDRAIDLDQKTAWVIVRRGITYYQIDQYDDALKDFDRAIDLDEKNAQAIVHRGATYRQMKRYEDALKDFDRAIDFDGKNAWAIARRGVTYYQMDRYDDALKDFDRAIDLDQKSAWVIARRAETYYQMERYDDALKDFDRAIDLDQKSAWVIARRGEIYFDTGKYEDALKDFNRAIELDEDMDWAIQYRSDIYRHIGKYEDALQDLEKLISFNDEDTELLFDHAEILRRLGKLSDALNEFNKIILLCGQTVDIHHLARRALTLKSMGEINAAKVDIEKALSMPYKDSRDHYNRAATFLVNEQVQDALLEFELAFIDKAAREFSITDDLLDSVRNLPGFKAMLAKYE